MREFLTVTKALSDENRVRVLLALDGGELCVCQLIELLGLAPSTVSKHMSLLYQAGLVVTRKQGRWIYYRLPEHPDSETAAGAIRLAQESLNDDTRIEDDRRRLKTIRRTDLETLCTRYHR
ncbi:MAG: ArsR/SmtB family transcription factor [Phycisphaerae bacterium]